MSKFRNLILFLILLQFCLSLPVNNADGNGIQQSSPAQNIPRSYMVLPNPSLTKEERTMITEQLIKILGHDKASAVGNVENGIVFWSAIISDQHVKNIQDAWGDNVYLVPDGSFAVNGQENQKRNAVEASWGESDLIQNPYLEKRNDVDYYTQMNSYDELTVISQSPADLNREDFSEVKSQMRYTYHSSEGAGVTVYVIDTGANTETEQYKTLKSPPRWIYGGKSLPPSIRKHQSYDEEKTDKIGHGTCMLSRAVSSFYGVSKASNVVVVKLPVEVGPEGEHYFFQSSLFEGLTQIRDDIISHKIPPGKGVINMSLASPANGGLHEKMLMNTLRSLIKEFTERDIPVVAGSGDRARESRHEDIDSYPALFGSDKSLSIIVVGSTNIWGMRSSFSPGSKNDRCLTTSAVGEQVRCPPASGLEKEVVVSGTSESAATVTGYVAYLLGLPETETSFKIHEEGKVCENVKMYIQTHHYERYVAKGSAVSMPMVFNHILPRNVPGTYKKILGIRDKWVVENTVLV